MLNSDVGGYVTFYMYILCSFFFMWNAVFNGHNMDEKPPPKKYFVDCIL